MKIDKATALETLRPGAEWSVTGEEITWLDNNQIQPSEQEIAAEIIKLQAEHDNQEYARQRKAEYDKLNQFEMQFNDQRDGTTTWVDAINEIKAKYPKE